MAFDALAAHARDEIGITEALAARPMQAAVVSAFSFLLGGSVPLLASVFATQETFIPIVATVSLFFLALLGAFAARIGGASISQGATRVLLWGAIAMGTTWMAGALFNVAT